MRGWGERRHFFTATVPFPRSRASYVSFFLSGYLFHGIYNDFIYSIRSGTCYFTVFFLNFFTAFIILFTVVMGVDTWLSSEKVPPVIFSSNHFSNISRREHIVYKDLFTELRFLIFKVGIKHVRVYKKGLAWVNKKQTVPCWFFLMCWLNDLHLYCFLWLIVFSIS